MAVDAASAVRDFITEDIIVESDVDIGFDTPLEGLVDSLGLQQVVYFIEEEYEITLDHEDMVVENFVTVGAIGDLVARKLRAGVRD